jgi:Xaa-Pro aminopeptidase
LNIFALETIDTKKPKAIRETPPAPKFTDAERHAELAMRRANVFKEMSDKSVMILFSAEPKLYAGDVDFYYRQENNLYYLTNLKQENATLVLIKDGANTQEILFLPKRNPLRESWEGRMYSREEATRISGLTTLLDSTELAGFIQSVKEKKAFSSGGVSVANTSGNLYLLLPFSPNDENGAREYSAENKLLADFAKVSLDETSREYKYESLLGYSVHNANLTFRELRHIKSPYEIKLMQHAVDITTEAQMRGAAILGRASWEYEVQAEVEYTFRRRNADFWGYPSIVGCGPNGTILHYVESQSPLKKGELVLMDVGAEYDHYTADVTRTFPVNGKFSKEQAEIYQVVFNAQEAAAKVVKPGATFQQAGQAATRTVAEGLQKLGLITDAAGFIPGTERQEPDGNGGTRIVGMPQRFLWYFHGLGHWLGMNVHDVGAYQTPLRAGMVFTNEPGIYIRENAQDFLPNTPEAKAWWEKIRPAFEKYKNIGVRIEDDILVTETGAEWMTKNLPRSLADVEAFIAKGSKEMSFTGLPQKSNPALAILNLDTNLFVNADLFSAQDLNGTTIRSGWISTGKETILAASNGD